MRSLWALLFVIGCVAFVGVTGSSDEHEKAGHGSSDEEEGHDHSEEVLFEQAVVYAVGAGNNTLVAVAGAEEETFAFMLVQTTTADMEGIHEAEEDVEAAWENFADGVEEPTLLASGDPALPSSTTVYQVALEDPLVAVRVVIGESGAYALFLEHGTDEVPVELMSAAGEVLVPSAEEVVEEEEEEEEEDENSPATGKQWANALIASFIISACSLVGIIIVIGSRVSKSINLSHACILASGALLATAILHIIPEAMEGLESDYPDDLHTLGLHAGIAVLAGISFGIFLHAALEAGHSHSHDFGHHATDGNTAVAESTVTDVECSYAPASAASPSTLSAGAIHVPVNRRGKETVQPQGGGEKSVNGDTVMAAKSLEDLIDANKDRALLDLADLQPVCWVVILGDLVHNFADGVTIGAAFLSCSSSVGWTVTAAAILHEIPHELADFMALINGGMSTKQAFAYNFMSALSAVLGVIVILSLREELTTAQVSFILLVGAGSFIFIALSELVPGALVASPSKSKTAALGSQVKKMLSFVVGALLIGIPLIFDKHCESGDHGHDH